MSVLPQPGIGSCLPHGPHFTGHPREGDHREPRAGAPDHAGGCPGGIGQHLCPLGQEGLLAIAGGARPAPAAELGLDIGPDRPVLHQGRFKGCRDRFGGEVVGGGAQAAGGDQQPATAGGFAHSRYHPPTVVAHHLLAVVGNAQAGKLFGQPPGIAVGDISEEELGANAEDFCAHKSDGLKDVALKDVPLRCVWPSRACAAGGGSEPAPRSRRLLPKPARGNASRHSPRPRPGRPAIG